VADTDKRPNKKFVSERVPPLRENNLDYWTGASVIKVK